MIILALAVALDATNAALFDTIVMIGQAWSTR